MSPYYGWNFIFVCSTTLLTTTYTTVERFKVQSLNDGIIFGTSAILSLSAGIIIQYLDWTLLNLLSFVINLFGIGLILCYLNNKEVESKTTMVSVKEN